MDDLEKSAIFPSTRSFEGEQAAGPPHEALFLVIAYLPLYELLAMSQVCVSLRDAVKKDILPWLNITVERPLSSRISDEILEEITSKAKGRLTTLALINCIKITDQGLQRVIRKNPHISMLYIPACTGLTPEGVMIAVKTLCQGNHRLNNLGINGIYNLKKEHLETLSIYLNNNQKVEEQPRQKMYPIFYHKYKDTPNISCSKSEYLIDLGICPMCYQVRMVFDCPRKECGRKQKESSTACRGCSFCIPRCEDCGGCIESDESEESACAESLCLECWLQLPKCNFCNRPYCKRHTNRWRRSPMSELLCEACETEYTGIVV